MFLKVMRHKGPRAEEIFTKLFHKCSASEVFRFLDERSTWREIYKIMQAVPRTPFVAAVNESIMKKIRG